MKKKQEKKLWTFVDVSDINKSYSTTTCPSIPCFYNLYFTTFLTFLIYFPLAKTFLAEN